MKKLLGGLALASCIATANAGDDERKMAPEQLDGTTLVTAEQTIELAGNKTDLVIIDARKAFEYQKGHIEGAVNLLDTDTTPESLAAVVATPQTPVVFYCNGPKCLRSSKAAALAVSWGYEQVYWFRGGWVEWKSKELPVAR